MCFPLQDLPDTVLEQILMMFSYDEISQLRRVNKRFNTICKGLLNKGFRSADNYQRKYFQEVKAQLPRRESDRLNHKLLEHFELLGRIETQFYNYKSLFAIQQANKDDQLATCNTCNWQQLKLATCLNRFFNLWLRDLLDLVFRDFFV